jgi:hypothetical protein
VAKSSLVATTFFAPSGLLGVLGIGSAATPIGWVAFAALASGGACYGLYRFLGNSKGSRIIEIPRFLNTPLDTLGLALFDLIAPLALRLAQVDGRIEPTERAYLITHLVEEWGLDRNFVEQAIQVIEPGLSDLSVEEMAKELANYLYANPDCKHQAIAAELSEFLREMLTSAGPLTTVEAEALSTVSELLRTIPTGKVANWWASAKSTLAPLALDLTASAARTAERVNSGIPSTSSIRTAAAVTRGSIHKGLNSAARAVIPSKETLKNSTQSVLSNAEASVSWVRKKIRGDSK